MFVFIFGQFSKKKKHQNASFFDFKEKTQNKNQSFIFVCIFKQFSKK